MKAQRNAAALMAAALVAGAAILALGAGNIMRTERTVSVRGLAEREADADLAVWPLTFQLGGDDLALLQGDLLEGIGAVTEYLASHGIAAEDVTVRAPAITDTSMNPYAGRDAQYTYIARQVVLVRSGNVAAVKQAQAQSLALMGRGVAISQDYGSRIQYEFTGLNAIKPDMIAEATRNARQAAEQFARDSGSKVGKIKTASQGVFSIEDAAEGLEEKKKIRVITTVTYLLGG